MNAVPPYLEGKVLTGSRGEVIRALEATPTPSLNAVAAGEVRRLRHICPELTADGRGIDIFQAFADIIGMDAAKLASYQLRHSIYRNHTYLSDPHIMRDLYKGSRAVDDKGERIFHDGGRQSRLLCLPATSWNKPGDAVFRFAIMHMPADNTGLGRRDSRQLRVPVVMLDETMLDVMERHAPGHALVKRLQTMAKAICHDYIHTAFLYYGPEIAPAGMESWNRRMHGATPIWRSSPLFNYNYEVLASIGHRQVMERVYERQPEVKERLIREVGEFSAGVEKLCAAIRAGEPEGEKLANRMERYLMSNYMRFAYHVLKPDEPGLSRVKEKYPYIAADLNLNSGKGLVSLLHAHDGVPAAGTGLTDVPFRDWLHEYVQVQSAVMEKQETYNPRERLNQGRRAGGIIGY